MDIPIQRTTYKVFDHDFTIDSRFQVIKEIGRGGYGIVCSAEYVEPPYQGVRVAIKKIPNVFSKTLACKRSLRELKLLRHFRGHKNIVYLFDSDIVFNHDNSFNGLYLYCELLDCDLHQIIQSKQPLTDSHYQYFIYQILCALKYIHSAGVLHRDLKPKNILINSDCQLKIADFGFARGYSQDPVDNNQFLTEYVATRWYRAPEIMLGYKAYFTAIDVWSVGCILAELLGGTAMFPGSDYVDQLNRILYVLGSPSVDTLRRIGSMNVQQYILQLGDIQKIPFKEIFTSGSILAIDMLEKTLTFDPDQRISVDDALRHPYLSVWHDQDDEPQCPRGIDFSFERIDDLNVLRMAVVCEVNDFRQFAREARDEGEDQSLSIESKYGEVQKQDLPASNVGNNVFLEGPSDPNNQRNQKGSYSPSNQDRINRGYM
ncbi:hypothetical protein KAFR_0E01580 [Kazachstania africana CBS 2517]|uniref:Mitogen-activated protein kinase n=1 Tax=Kazachstania africana (strain ATCC 22294 / BCRC 22015 / CBS 2517 / CECT 1963 / NBRC 1671 / NRRL Y-8276) TaxID=1071382 RepID=H2AVB2_KAZAF|nr:hypothetical protein KAFR_0E01580 [Kazachstania africana CBS 2517]CCF58312.1 hypothetical protein KAFR_0E01580 [Kazachstania africana CBS 2517]